jgi:hypothetical protein
MDSLLPVPHSPDLQLDSKPRSGSFSKTQVVSRADFEAQRAVNMSPTAVSGVGGSRE